MTDTRNMPRYVDIAGERFGRLVVRSFSGIEGRKARWVCVCDCGNISIAVGSNLRGGQTRSCGCLQKETVGALKRSHKMCRTGAYRTWASIKSRCYNPNQGCHAKYGALGVKMCQRWLESFENFLSDMGERPVGMTLDRENPFGDYEPSNCRWATSKEQGLNKRGHVAIAIIEHLRSEGYGDLIDLAFRKRYSHGHSKSAEGASEARLV